MLIHTGENGWVEWYNNVLTQEAAAAYLDENTVWLDISLPAIPPHKDGFVPRLRLTEEKTLTYDYEPEPEPTMDEQILSGVNSTNESQLIIMEALATQYEEGLENDLNNKEVLATIYEELLAQKEVK